MIDPDNPPDADIAVEVTAELRHAEPPRVWSAITVPLLAIFVGTIVAGVVLVLAIMEKEIPLGPSNIAEATAKLLSEPIGIWVAIIPGQAVFLAAAVLAAFLSPVEPRRRLQMSGSRFPIWTWCVFAVATPGIGIVMSLLVEMLGIEMSQQLELMNDMIGGKSGVQLAITAILVGVVPGFVEEVLFRGYLQSRLLQRWSPAAAIGVSGAIFALAHLDPLHLVLVFPIGIWLGIIAWRTRSIWPAVLCHMVNNLVAVLLSPGEDVGAQLQPGPSEYTLLIPCSLAMIASIYLMRGDATAVDAN